MVNRDDKMSIILHNSEWIGTKTGLFFLGQPLYFKIVIRRQQGMNWCRDDGNVPAVVTKEIAELPENYIYHSNTAQLFVLNS